MVKKPIKKFNKRELARLTQDSFKANNDALNKTCIARKALIEGEELLKELQKGNIQEDEAMTLYEDLAHKVRFMPPPTLRHNNISEALKLLVEALSR